MKKTILIAFVLALLSLPALVIAQPPSPPMGATQAELLAGNPKNGIMDVGEVYVWNDATYIYVLYDVTEPGWGLTSTHVHIQADDGDGNPFVGSGKNAKPDPQDENPFPMNNGNPPPGQFDFSDPHGATLWYLYEIRIVDEPHHNWTGDFLFLAIHGVVQQWGCDPAFLPTVLPDEAYLTVTRAVDETDAPEPDLAYFSEVLISSIPSPTILDGSYLGWCVDIDSEISEGYPYISGVYSSYGPIPAGIMDNPENLDLVNYILNQDIVGQSSSCPPAYEGDDGIYTYGDVQQAIWYLLEGGRSGYPDFEYSLGPWSECRRDEIVADALANGVDFVPGCGECVGVIVIPEASVPEDVRQAVLVMICGPGGDETVWAGFVNGDVVTFPFPGKNWALYITYDGLED